MSTEIINNLKHNNDQLQAQIAKLADEMRSNSKELIKQVFQHFFERYGDVVEHIFWTQYTPYFNDGETCEFSVREPHILLKNDENACEYEGSYLYDVADVQDIKEKLCIINEWKADKLAAALKYQRECIAKNNFNPFEPKKIFTTHGWVHKTEAELLSEWKPFYNIEEVEQELELAEMCVSQYPELKSAFSALCDTVYRIDEDIMKTIFGDHAKVIVSASGIEIEEYIHD